MLASLFQFLFPAAYRDFPYKRLVLGLLRAGHILSFAILVGGLYFQQNAEQLFPWVIGTIITGVGMFLIELYGSCMLLFEVQSIAVLIKVFLLVSMLSLDEDGHIIVLIGLVIFSSLVSHAPRSIRHINLAPRFFQEKYGFQKGK